MNSFNQFDVRLSPGDFRGRTFLLGNKRAFSLSLPVASGPSDSLLHPHKWFGAYLYGRKFFEGQLVRAGDEPGVSLNYRVQTALTMGLTSAKREYVVEDVACTEEFFVPDGIQGLACTLDGDTAFTVEPEFDMRYSMAVLQDTRSYTVDAFERGALISQPLPSGSYDDLSETFVCDPSGEIESTLYAAVEVQGEGASVHELPPAARARRKRFLKDQRRRRTVGTSAPEDARSDHAPLWTTSESRVFAPVRFNFRGHGTVFYGFGTSREEALQQLAALRDNFLAFQGQKNESAAKIVDEAHFSSGVEAVDTAYVQVLSRIMDALVARHASAEDTGLSRSASMILAGNQYFHDSWKRDENIALGALLTLGFYDLARDVIQSTWQLQDERTGRLPQRIRVGEEPPYHSSDGTLWALQRLYQYWRCTGDEALLYSKMPMIRHFFDRSLDRSVLGMLPSGRTHAPDYLWETWMDTPHTPRDGFPIEIQMLWISCLRLFRPLIKPLDVALEGRMAEAEAMAWEALKRFTVRDGIPADSLDAGLEVRDLITPNPFFCFGLGLDLGPEVERLMRKVGRTQLAGNQGIKTLAPFDWSRVFPGEFLSNRKLVRGRHMRSVGKFNYHRGVEWNWLTQFFVRAELKYGEPDVAYRKYLLRQVRGVLEVAGIGGISELFDLKGSRGPEFQAWSMAGFLEALHAFAGVRIDVPARSIRIRPQLPAAWPWLEVRRWYGPVPLDIRYEKHAHELDLAVRFPWGDAPDARLDLTVPLPPRTTAGSVDIQVDGVDYLPTWHVDHLPGTDKQFVRTTVPAAAEVRVTVRLEAVRLRLLAHA